MACPFLPERVCAMGWSWALSNWAWIVSTTRLNLRLGPKKIKCTHTYSYNSEMRYSGGKIILSLLILYTCPLAKKLSVYNFNGRFIWTVRDRITTTKSIKTHLKKLYKLISILMSQISIWYPINQQDFWLAGVFSKGKELRLGALS